MEDLVPSNPFVMEDKSGTPEPMNVYVGQELSGIPLIVLDVVMGSCGMNLP